jgi:hypothetical protein
MKLSNIKTIVALPIVAAALTLASGGVSAQQHIAEQLLEESLQDQQEQVAEEKRDTEETREVDVTTTNPADYGIKADTII